MKNIGNTLILSGALVALMTLGCSLHAGFADFKTKIQIWARENAAPQSAAAAATSVMPFSTVVDSFKAISFKNIEQARQFSKIMTALNLSEAQKTTLMNSNESFKALITAPEVQAVLLKEDPGFWGSWFALFGRIVKAVVDVAQGSVNALAGAASSAGSAASSAVSSMFDYGTTNVMNLTDHSRGVIKNPGRLVNGADYNNYISSIDQCNSLATLLAAKEYLVSQNAASETVNALKRLYAQRYEVVLAKLYKSDVREINNELGDLYRNFEIEALAILMDPIHKVNVLKLYYDIEQQGQQKSPYGQWLWKQKSCFDPVKWLFSCGRGKAKKQS